MDDSHGDEVLLGTYFHESIAWASQRKQKGRGNLLSVST